MTAFNFNEQTGVVVPDTSETLRNVQAEFVSAFGSDLSLAPETPQGVLMAIEADARDETLRLNAKVANQVNPNQATGQFLDALWALTGGARRQATRSRVEGVVLTGVPGTVVPANSAARVEGTGATFRSEGAAVIGPDGTTTAVFLSSDFGPVEAAAGKLTEVATQVLGWETITNPSAARPGQLRELDGNARQRRRETLALQSVALLPSLSSRLYDTEGVRSCSTRENVTDAVAVIDGVTMAPHSVYACIDGGTDEDVARVLLSRKSLGAGWNGATVVPVVEPSSGQTYEVKFDRPEHLNVFVRVEISGASTLADPAGAVRSSILNYANGDQDGEAGLIVGRDVSPFELSGAVNREYPALQVRSVTIGLTSGTLTTNGIPVGIMQRASIVEGNIQVVLANG